MFGRLYDFQAGKGICSDCKGERRWPDQMSPCDKLCDTPTPRSVFVSLWMHLVRGHLTVFQHSAM